MMVRSLSVGYLTRHPEEGERGQMKKKDLFMSPLADPVVGAIFSGMEQAGLAAESLVGSILRENGYTLGKVIDVVPQRYYKTYPGMRGCRVDVHVFTAEMEKVIVEVQLLPEPILTRNVFEVSQTIAASIPTGADPETMKNLMPHIIVINILGFDLRDDNKDFIQPVELLYSKPPHIVAEDHILIYNVQLSRFRKQVHDLTKPLDAWLYILDTANQKRISLEEVIEMEPILRETIDVDAGLKQFAEGYSRVAADPKVQEEYRMYYSELMRINGMLQMADERARAEGEARGEARGKAEGEVLGIFKAIQRLMNSMNMSAEQAMKILEIPEYEMSQYLNLLHGQ
jgi:hypothetical protein